MVTQIRCCARFVTSIVDEGVEDEQDWVEWPGRVVSGAIVQLLRDAGFEVTNPTHEAEHGWDFTVRHAKRTIWVEVTDLGAYILQTKVTDSFDPFLKRRRAAHIDVLRALAEVLAKDSRFDEIGWFSKGDLDPDAKGEPTPVSEEP